MVRKRCNFLEYTYADQIRSDRMSFNWTPDELNALVNEHRIVLFMKGTPEQPQCGFSNRAATVLNQLGEPFASVNVLADPRAIPSVCTWADFPTMPQVYIHGELIGGSDIALEMFQSGELQQMIADGDANSE
jgi:monothiol glutaredoxin